MKQRSGPKQCSWAVASYSWLFSSFNTSFFPIPHTETLIFLPTRDGFTKKREKCKAFSLSFFFSSFSPFDSDQKKNPEIKGRRKKKKKKKNSQSLSLPLSLLSLLSLSFFRFPLSLSRIVFCFSFLSLKFIPSVFRCSSLFWFFGQTWTEENRSFQPCAISLLHRSQPWNTGRWLHMIEKSYGEYLKLSVADLRK